MAKRLQTMIDECEAMTREACRLVDARDDGDTTAAAKLEEVRARRDAMLADIRKRPDGRRYDRWEAGR